MPAAPGNLGVVNLATVEALKLFELPNTDAKTFSIILFGSLTLPLLIGGAIATALTLKTGVIHPTINLDTPDPDCDLDYVPKAARETRVRRAISNSFGFGGHNTTLVLAAV